MRNLSIVLLMSAVSVSAQTFEVKQVALGKTQVNAEQAKGEIVQDKDLLFIRTGGYVYSAKYTPAKLTGLKQLPALKGLEPKISHITVIDDTLWVMKEGVDLSYEEANFPLSLKPLLGTRLLTSTDRGANFKPFETSIFQRLIESPFGNITQFAPMTKLSQTVINGKKTLVLNGSGTSAYSMAQGEKQWKPMVKTSQDWSDSCTASSIEIVGTRALIGGECPLDHAFIQYGDIGKDGKIAKLVDVKVKGFENRMVQFITQDPSDPKLIFAGVEGGLLVSRDGGKSFGFTFKEGEHPVPGREGRQYPYMRKVLFQSFGKVNAIIAGGQSQATQGTIIISTDAGKTWNDYSSRFLGADEYLGMEQLSNGKIVIASRKPVDFETGIFSAVAKITEIELKLKK